MSLSFFSPSAPVGRRGCAAIDPPRCQPSAFARPCSELYGSWLAVNRSRSPVAPAPARLQAEEMGDSPYEAHRSSSSHKKDTPQTQAPGNTCSQAGGYHVHSSEAVAQPQQASFPSFLAIERQNAASSKQVLHRNSFSQPPSFQPLLLAAGSAAAKAKRVGAYSHNCPRPHVAHMRVPPAAAAARRNGRKAPPRPRCPPARARRLKNLQAPTQPHATRLSIWEEGMPAPTS